MASLVRKHSRSANRERVRGEKRRARELGMHTFRLFDRWKTEVGPKGTLSMFLAWLDERAEDEGWSESRLVTVKRVVTDLLGMKAKQLAAPRMSGLMIPAVLMAPDDPDPVRGYSPVPPQP